MTRWAKAMGGLAFWAMSAFVAQAQFPGGAGGAPGLPEPLGVPSGAGMVPGPSGPVGPPMEVPEYMSLPAGGPSAFMAEDRFPECAVFFHIGGQALQRNSPAGPPLGYFNPVPPAGSSLNPATAVGFPDISPNMAWGVKGTLGILYENHAFEVTGFYIPANTATTTVAPTGGMSLPFGPLPPELAPYSSILSGATSVQPSLKTALGNIETNYRVTNLAIFNCEAIVGFRYTDLQETGNVISSAPAGSIDYQTRSFNRMLLPQLGFEHNLQPWHGISLGSQYKVGLGPNLTQSYISVNDGSGLNLVSGSQSLTTFAQVYEINAYANLFILERFRLKMGVDLMFLNGIVEPGRIYNPNLSAPSITSQTGSAFFWGPSVECQFLF